MANCPRCGEEANTGESGSYYYCPNCMGMGNLAEDKRRFADEN